MIAFHRPRLAALAAAGVDLLACETLPSFAELQALLTLLQEFPTLGARFAFTLRDSQHLSDGTPLPESCPRCAATRRCWPSASTASHWTRSPRRCANWARWPINRCWCIRTPASTTMR